jgi:hypothetical protein
VQIEAEDHLAGSPADEVPVAHYFHIMFGTAGKLGYCAGNTGDPGTSLRDKRRGQIRETSLR